MASSTEDRFNVELLKLLMQVAWGDGRLEPAEAQMFFGVGRSWSVPEDELSSLRTVLESGKALPPPNLALLRTRREEVLEAARALVNTDGYVGAEETELLAEVESLLG